MRSLSRFLETVFETFLFNSRLIVILAVIGSLTSSVLMFVRGAILIAHTAKDFAKHWNDAHSDDLSIALISSVDSFLFATVLLIFAMGIYELFISKIDPASRTEDSRPNWLQIHSLDDLKGAVGKVILMILIVRLFESAVKMKYDHPLHLLYLGLAVLFVAAALFLQHLGHKKHHAEEAQHDKHHEKPARHVATDVEARGSDRALIAPAPHVAPAPFTHHASIGHADRTMHHGHAHGLAPNAVPPGSPMMSAPPPPVQANPFAPMMPPPPHRPLGPHNSETMETNPPAAFANASMPPPTIDVPSSALTSLPISLPPQPTVSSPPPVMSSSVVPAHENAQRPAIPRPAPAPQWNGTRNW